jgi:phospholipid/cholesterol/gamma-HCH transport system substrate-binding protein
MLLNDQKTAEQIKAIMQNLEGSSKKLDQNMEALTTQLPAERIL